MRADALDLELHLQPSLLADAQQVCQPAGGFYRRSAALVDGEGGGYLFGVVLRQPTEAVASAVFLVCAGA